MAADDEKWWQKYGTVGQIVQTLVAALGFGALLMQINAISDSNRTASARQVYLGYLEKEFQYPQFAAPDYARIKAGDINDRLRYESFVSYFLYACEEALAAFGRRKEWQNTCDDGVKGHLPFLCEKMAEDSSYLKTFSDDTAKFIKSAMTRFGVASPECKLKAS